MPEPGVKGRDGYRYLGTYEFAEACGVSRQAVTNWTRRGKCPEPFAVLAMGPVWRLTAPVREFIRVKKGAKWASSTRS